jgi:cell division protease FtsH
MKIIWRQLILFGLCLALIFLICTVVADKTKSNKPVVKDLSYSEFISAVEKGLVKEVSINGPEINGQMTSEKGIVKFRTRGPEKSDDYLPLLRKKGVKIVFIQPPSSSCGVLGLWLPLIILILIYFWFFRKMNVGISSFDFTRSKAKLFLEQNTGVTFKDVGGIPEVKKELQEIIEFLKNPGKFARLGARLPKGTLLVGPPGCGKTLLARAVAGEAGVPFFSVSGSEFVELYVGVGAARIRDLFTQAKSYAPCIIFIDELDAVGGARGISLNANSEREQTLNQLLVEMDGFEPHLGIVVLAATNRPDMLDKGLLRPGRFNRQIYIPMPDVEGRLAILKIHTRNIPLANDVDLKEIAQMMAGASGADLENVANEAAILASRENQDRVRRIDFLNAIDKVLMGLERKIIIPPEEKKRVAVHEAGHALVTYYLSGREKLEKISIIPRGMALGITKQRHEEDRYLFTSKELKRELAILLAGRAAEEIVLQDVSSGAANDLERATDIVERMIQELGMTEELLGVYAKRRQTFLGEYTDSESYSEKTAEKIDSLKEKILKDTYHQAKEILIKNLVQLNLVVERLLEKETIDREEFEKLINQNKAC